MSLKLYDTMAREKRTFVPANPERVTMYVCGPTVYGHAHIGNFRPVVVFDVLFRVLRYLYGQDAVVYARNVTDVDDKINAKAQAEGVPIKTITDRYLAAYNADATALKALPPSLAPHATDHIQAMQDQIAALIQRGAAYAAEGHVLFSIEAFPDYGRLSGRPLDEMIAGARVEVAPYKRHPADFVLWKPSKPGEPVWDSPWGAGRPGWHIECSAMIEAVLGLPIDIHGGGIDLTFPHHENELAQARCAHDLPTYANYWLHNGFLDMSGEKMSKSLGNVIIPHELLETTPGEVIRWALLSAHYRQPLDWTERLLLQSQRALDRLYRALYLSRRLPIVPSAPDFRVVEALFDDLNTPKASAVLFELASELNANRLKPEGPELRGRLLASAQLLGFAGEEPREWLLRGAKKTIPHQEIRGNVQERSEIRRERDFEESDLYRKYLKAKWIDIQDSKSGQDWRPAQSIERVEEAAWEAAKALGFDGATLRKAEWLGVDFIGERQGSVYAFDVKTSLSSDQNALDRLVQAWNQALRHAPVGKAVVYVLVPSFGFRSVEARSLVRKARKEGVRLRVASFDGLGALDRLVS